MGATKGGPVVSCVKCKFWISQSRSLEGEEDGHAWGRVFVRKRWDGMRKVSGSLRFFCLSLFKQHVHMPLRDG